jgi:hypothetical protein
MKRVVLTPSKQDQLEQDKLDFEKTKHQFEILRALHSAGLERWKDRRENEWKLNYAIWAAIAGLDGLLLHDRSGICLSWWILGSGSLACLALHFAYLWPTIERAIGEIKLQDDAERGMKRLISAREIRQEIKDAHLGGSIHRYEERDAENNPLENKRSRSWKRYGLIAPLLFTIALLLIGVFLMRGYGKNEPRGMDKGVVVQYLNDPLVH